VTRYKTFTVQQAVLRFTMYVVYVAGLCGVFDYLYTGDICLLVICYNVVLSMDCYC